MTVFISALGPLAIAWNTRKGAFVRALFSPITGTSR